MRPWLRRLVVVVPWLVASGTAGLACAGGLAQTVRIWDGVGDASREAFRQCRPALTRAQCDLAAQTVPTGAVGAGKGLSNLPSTARAVETNCQRGLLIEYSGVPGNARKGWLEEKGCPARIVDRTGLESFEWPPPTVTPTTATPTTATPRTATPRTAPPTAGPATTAPTVP